MKRKGSIVLLVLGCLGILQYLYFQFFTDSALVYNRITYPDPVWGKYGLMQIETVGVTHNWFVGILPAIIGVILLIISVVKLKPKLRIADG